MVSTPSRIWAGDTKSQMTFDVRRNPRCWKASAVALYLPVMPPFPASETLRRDMFRLAAVAFLVVPAAELVAAYLGPRMPVDYPGLWGASAAGGIRAAVTWVLPWH